MRISINPAKTYRWFRKCELVEDCPARVLKVTVTASVFVDKLIQSECQNDATKPVSLRAHQPPHYYMALLGPRIGRARRLRQADWSRRTLLPFWRALSPYSIAATLREHPSSYLMTTLPRHPFTESLLHIARVRVVG